MNANSVATEFSPNFTVAGITTITWGTDGVGILSGTNYAISTDSGPPYPQPSRVGYVVVSYSEEDRIEEIPIEQGTGFEAVIVLLNKGKNVDISVIDDTAIAPPTIANNPLVISSPFVPSFNVLLVGKKADAARKREGMRTFTLKSFNAITGAH